MDTSFQKSLLRDEGTPESLFVFIFVSFFFFLESQQSTVTNQLALASVSFSSGQPARAKAA